MGLETILEQYVNPEYHDSVTHFLQVACLIILVGHTIFDFYAARISILYEKPLLFFGSAIHAILGIIAILAFPIVGIVYLNAEHLQVLLALVYIGHSSILFVITRK